MNLQVSIDKRHHPYLALEDSYRIQEATESSSAGLVIRIRSKLATRMSDGLFQLVLECGFRHSAETRKAVLSKNKVCSKPLFSRRRKTSSKLGSAPNFLGRQPYKPSSLWTSRAHTRRSFVGGPCLACWCTANLAASARNGPVDASRPNGVINL
jgi:hypothetical protein